MGDSVIKIHNNHNNKRTLIHKSGSQLHAPDLCRNVKRKRRKDSARKQAGCKLPARKLDEIRIKFEKIKTKNHAES